MAWLNGARRRGNDVMETHDFLLREEVTDVKYIIFVGDERLVNLDYETTNIYEISFRLFFLLFLMVSFMMPYGFSMKQVEYNVVYMQ